MVQVIWTEPALEDLREIHDFIARDSAQHAQVTIRRIQDAVGRLDSFPLSGRIVPEFPGGPYRQHARLQLAAAATGSPSGCPTGSHLPLAALPAAHVPRRRAIRLSRPGLHDYDDGGKGMTRPVTRRCGMKKSEVLEILRDLPEDLDVDTFIYTLYVRRRIEIGIAAADAGDLVPHEEIEREMEQWPE